MRGLKRNQPYKHYRPRQVASFTDAWIETNGYLMADETKAVASFTDAWIETFIDVYHGKTLMSHLLQMRGLKQ